MLLALALLQGCAARGLSIDALAADETLITGSVRPAADKEAVDEALISDRNTMRNAVTSAIVDELPAGGVGWANAETGSRGLIAAIWEERKGGLMCRHFQATRESYAGVHLYRGRTCLGSSRLWAMSEFMRVE